MKSPSISDQPGASIPAEISPPAPSAREPYVPPTIEMFPPMQDVTFGSNNVGVTSATAFPG